MSLPVSHQEMRQSCEQAEIELRIWSWGSMSALSALQYVLRWQYAYSCSFCFLAGCIAEKKLICSSGEKRAKEVLSMSDQSQNLFKWRHFQADIIPLCVRWYLRYARDRESSRAR
jgi:hypothetical protein